MSRAASAGKTVRRLARAALVASLLAAGCSSSGREADAPVSRRLPLRAPVSRTASLGLDPWGRAWISDAGRLTVLDTARGTLLARMELGSRGPYRIVGFDTAAVYLHTASRVISFTPDSGKVRARRNGVGEDGFALDPGGGGAYVIAPRGGVTGVRAGSLRAQWGWPQRGPSGTAIAVSPLGDRVYLALAEEGDADQGRIVTFDWQSGRVLAESEAPGRVRALLAGAEGTLYALTGTGWRRTVAALAPGPEGLEELWTRPVRSLGLGDSVRVVASPTAGRVAVLSPDDGELRLLDGATGEIVWSEEGVVDAAFTPRGSLYLLTARELRVVGAR